ncbi:MAG: hypothetical protein ABSE49_27230, partial [Polyangiaceae bacterium]
WVPMQMARLLLAWLRGDPSVADDAKQAIASRGGVANIGLLRVYFPAFVKEVVAAHPALT